MKTLLITLFLMLPSFVEADSIRMRYKEPRKIEAIFTQLNKAEFSINLIGRLESIEQDGKPYYKAHDVHFATFKKGSLIMSGTMDWTSVTKSKEEAPRLCKLTKSIAIKDLQIVSSPKGAILYLITEREALKIVFGTGKDSPVAKVIRLTDLPKFSPDTRVLFSKGKLPVSEKVTSDK